MYALAKRMPRKLSSYIYTHVHTYQCHLSNNELCVVERTNLFVALAVDNGHGLKTHGLHVGLGREEEAMIEVVEELSTVVCE